MNKIHSFSLSLIVMVGMISCKPETEKSIHQVHNLENISQIENGLLPGMVIKGDSIKTSSLIEAMNRNDIVGTSIAVIENGKIDWVKGYGLANKTLNIDVDSSTLFQAASISKPITALGVLKLMEQGKLDLDENVNSYLKNYKVTDNEFTQNKKVTLRRLLTHTAGTNVHGFPGYKTSDSIITTMDVLEGRGNTDMVEVKLEPGTEYKYSGGGYTIVQKVIEDITGQEFSEYMDKEILEQIGMPNSTFAYLSPKTDAEQASAAFNSEGKQIEGDWHNYPEKAAAALWTTPSDLARYIINIQQIYLGKKDGLLQPETVKMMLNQNENQQGLGPGLLKEGDSLMFHHSGKNEGFTTLYIAFATKGKGLVMMSNSDNGGRIFSDIERAVSAHYNWDFRETKIIEPVQLSNEYLQGFVGTYKYIEQVPSVGGDYLAEVKLVDGNLVATDIPDELDYHLIATDSLHFLDINKNERITFNKVKEDYILMWGNRFEFRRLD